MRLVIAAAVVMVAGPAWAQWPANDIDTVPHYDPDRMCSEFYQKANSEYRNRFINDCIEAEQSDYDFLKSVWTDVSIETRAACLKIMSSRYEMYSVLNACIGPRYANEKARSEPVQHFQR